MKKVFINKVKNGSIVDPKHKKTANKHKHNSTNSIKSTNSAFPDVECEFYESLEKFDKRKQLFSKEFVLNSIDKLFTIAQPSFILRLYATLVFKTNHVISLEEVDLSKLKTTVQIDSFSVRISQLVFIGTHISRNNKNITSVIQDCAENLTSMDLILFASLATEFRLNIQCFVIGLLSQSTNYSLSIKKMCCLQCIATSFAIDVTESASFFIDMMPYRDMQEINRWMIVGASRTNRVSIISNVFKNNRYQPSKIDLDHAACCAVFSNNLELYFAFVGLGARDFSLHKSIAIQLSYNKSNHKIAHMIHTLETTTNVLNDLHRDAMEQISKKMKVVSQAIQDLNPNVETSSPSKAILNTQPEQVAQTTSDYHMSLAVESISDAMFLPFASSLGFS